MTDLSIDMKPGNMLSTSANFKEAISVFNLIRLSGHPNGNPKVERPVHVAAVKVLIDHFPMDKHRW